MARGLADYLEIPPELAERAGEPALAAMMEIKHGVDAGGGDLRQVHLCHAQNHMARLDPYRHGPLLQHLQALVVSLGGRRGDTRIAHVTPGEVVLGDDLMTPDVVDLLRRTAKEKGLDYERFVVGSGRNSINPRTGQMEFSGEDGGDGQSDTSTSYQQQLGNLPDPSKVANLPDNPNLPPMVPQLPPGMAIPPDASLRQNIQDAQHSWNPFWFYNQVRTHKGMPDHGWDYKQEDGQYRDFGNFNYGAAGAAFGFPEGILKRAAGWAEGQSGNKTTGQWWGAPPYGDSPRDQDMIQKGIDYYKKGGR
jgi:hypothetical protein